jgi:SAM-dependent methyltransferase
VRPIAAAIGQSARVALELRLHMSHDYDLRLFQSLNDDYRATPIWPASEASIRPQTRFRERPHPQDDQPSEDRLRRERQNSEMERGEVESKLRVFEEHGLDLRGCDVVEIGCANGWLTVALPKRTGAQSAVGVDIRPFVGWEAHLDPRVRFVVGDITEDDDLLPSGSADAVVSLAVMEHVQRPLQMLAAIHRLLRPNGTAWLYFNLYRGPNSSHVYREVYFPWPHLLFEASVCQEFYREHHGRDLTFSWVNKLTMAEYVLASIEIGFDIRKAALDRVPIDADLYLQFEDKLGRYPALDLETTFLTMVLDKTATPSRVVPHFGYLEAERSFQRRLEPASDQTEEADEPKEQVGQIATPQQAPSRRRAAG